MIVIVLLAFLSPSTEIKIGFEVVFRELCYYNCYKQYLPPGPVFISEMDDKKIKIIITLL
jgi:hypothetical protein